MLPSYAKAQVVGLVAVDSLDPSSESLNIDLIILAYIDDLALNA
jgi:hypothetical protein